MSEEVLNSPPFPELTWCECDWWEGTARFPAWAGYLASGGAYGTPDSASSPSDGTTRLSVTPHDPAVSRLPSDAQVRAYQYQLDHGAEIVAAALQALPPYYEKLRPRWEAVYGPEATAKLMPRVAGPGDFRCLIGLHQIHIHPWQRAGLGYVGLEFGCTWDREHGLGVMLHGNRIVDIGSADTSFAWAPKEADES